MISYSLDLPLKKRSILDTLLDKFLSWLKSNASLQSTFTSKLTNIQNNIAFHPYPTFQEFELDVFNVILELRINSRSRLWQQLAVQMTS